MKVLPTVASMIVLSGLAVVLIDATSHQAPKSAGSPLLLSDSPQKLCSGTEEHGTTESVLAPIAVAADTLRIRRMTRFQAIFNAYAKFAQMDEEQLKDWLRREHELTYYSEDLDEFTVAITRLAEQDPDHALRIIQEFGVLDNTAWGGLWIDRIFEAWAIIDLTQALNAARELPVKIRMIAGQSILLAVQGDSNVAEHIERALGVSITKWSINTHGESSLTEHRSDWQSAIENEAAEFELSDIAISWAEVDPVASLDAVMALDNLQHWTSRSGLGSQVAAMWARNDPELAKDWVTSLPASELRAHAMASVFHSLAQIDPKSTLDAATLIQDEVERKLSVSAVLSSWASKDLDGAMSAFESISDPELRRESVFSVAHRVALSDPPAAFYWASTLGAEESSRVIPSIVGQQAATDPETAARWIKQIEDWNVQQQSAMHVATQWADVDPTSALIWAQTGTAESITPSAVDRVFMVWATKNRDEAIAGLDMIGDSEIRDMIEDKLIN